MKTGVSVLLALSCACLLSGCYASLRLYPVRGPLAEQTPPQAFTAKLTAPPGLTFSVALANGETFQGKVKILAGPPPAPLAPNPPPAVPPQPNLASAWDSVYGPGFYVAHVVGYQLGQAVLTGSQGTVIQVEIWNARGVAVDNKGNIYKLVLGAAGAPQAN
jgi:hypothetical protein